MFDDTVKVTNSILILSFFFFFLIVQVVVAVAVVVIEVVVVVAFSVYMLIFLKYGSLSKVLWVFENQKFYKYLAQAKKRNSHKK